MLYTHTFTSPAGLSWLQMHRPVNHNWCLSDNGDGRWHGQGSCMVWQRVGIQPTCCRPCRACSIKGSFLNKKSFNNVASFPLQGWVWTAFVQFRRPHIATLLPRLKALQHWTWASILCQLFSVPVGLTKTIAMTCLWVLAMSIGILVISFEKTEACDCLETV